MAKQDKLINTSMKVGLQMNLKDAIEDCGVKVPSSVCLWEYPEIIRNNLVANTLNNVNIKGKDVINISSSVENENLVYTLSTKYDASKLDRPNFAEGDWKADTNVKDIFDDLFVNILPNVRGVHAGDMTITDASGTDKKTWHNTLFNTTGVKLGLLPSAKYIRLYLTCQAEPIFIHIGNLTEDLTNGYNVMNSDTVEFELDNNNMTMTAHVNCITKEHVDKLI